MSEVRWDANLLVDSLKGRDGHASRVEALR